MAIRSKKTLKKSLIFDLQLAITENNSHKIQSILCENQMDLNSIQFIGKSSPLSFAIYHRFINCIQLLLNAGSDPNRLSVDSLGRIERPLCTAVRLGDSNIVKLILNCPDIDVNGADFFGQTPVWLAVRERRPDFVDLIVNHKNFYMNSKHFQNRDSNPLYLSAKYLTQGRVDCFKCLLNIGFKADNETIDLIMKTDNKFIINLIELSNGKVILRSDELNRHPVLSLQQLTRVLIRNTYSANTCRPINSYELKKCFNCLPKKLINFLVNL